MLSWREIDVRAAEYYADELSAAGIEAVPFSPIELAIRGLPEAVRGCEVEQVMRIALQAARRGSPIRVALGNRLPPLLVSDDLADVSNVIEKAREAGLPLSPRVVDPAMVARGTG